jgi:beta-mannosidase
MITAEIHSGWQMRQAGWEEFLPASVPGSVYHDLMQNGKMDDPFWRDNFPKALKRMDHDYEYKTEFSADKALLKSDAVLLRFEGIDTVADIFLNGEKLGHTENMHRTFEFEVKDLLKEEGNELRVLLHSPTRFIKEEYKHNVADGSEEAMVGFANLRKTHCMFGWDWGPRLPDAGLWRPVKLLGIEKARVDSVYVTQKHEDGKVTLHFDVDADVYDREALMGYTVLITDPDGKETLCKGSPEEIVIERPQLWWPNGFGAQPLYTVEVRLYAGGKQVDAWKKRIGLRTLTMHIEKDAYGESFAHEVNGVQVFAMGADYIPEDSIFPRINEARTRELLRQCKEAHFNTIRVWGGGYYPDDWFYDACDEMGLMVWQDFLFACAVYNLTDEFEDNIRAEFADNIKRLRHHASLALWCGNNEMEMFVERGLWVKTPIQKSDYVKMYEYILPKVLKELDPQTFYWPASPSSGGGFDDPNGFDRGDVHYWDVWHGNVPFTDYRRYYFRYLSEFGFQSFPSVETVKTFALPEDCNPFSYVMEKHQRNNAANGKIMNYLYQTYLYPTSFDAFVYASQLLQADAIRYGVEHFRRNRGRCMGAVYWQLNDCWPVISWASIDYCGRWKALHYAAKRFFRPLTLSCAEEGLLTQNPNINFERYEYEENALKKGMRLCVENETMLSHTVEVTWQLRRADASVIRQGRETVTVEPLSSKWLEYEDFADADTFGDYIAYQMTENGAPAASGTALFCAPKHFRFADPQLALRVEGDEIVVTAAAYARSVQILNADDTLKLSDNFFDMNAGETRVRILSGQPSGLRVRSVYDIR